jgi:hypothetical protein
MEYVTLSLKPDPDTPTDLPFRSPRIQVPLYPAAHPAPVDTSAAIGFPVAMYRSRAEAVSYAIPVEMPRVFDWFEHVFSSEGFRCQSSKGRSGNRRTGEFIEWMVLSASPPDNPDLKVQLTFRRRGDDTVLTYDAEEHPAPLRHSESYLSKTTERIEVKYTFLNGPRRTIHRTVTDPAAIGTLVEAITALPSDNRKWTTGTFWPGGWADLRCIAPGEPDRTVHVDASHGIVVVDGFPALRGNLWLALVSAAPPPSGASGTPGMDWEKALG